jgi:hypothetical protein
MMGISQSDLPDNSSSKRLLFIDRIRAVLIILVILRYLRVVDLKALGKAPGYMWRKCFNIILLFYPVCRPRPLAGLPDTKKPPKASS